MKFQLDTDAVLGLYRENYVMAIEDGHTDNASKIAWEWTEQTVMDRFTSIKAHHEAAQQEAINKTFFG
jgi:hypothetical protein